MGTKEPDMNELEKARSEGAKSARMVAAKELNPREAVTAFVSWLTTRSKVISVGSTAEIPAIADLMEAFCDSQGFALVREDFTDRIAPYPDK